MSTRGRRKTSLHASTWQLKLFINNTSAGEHEEVNGSRINTHASLCMIGRVVHDMQEVLRVCKVYRCGSAERSGLGERSDPAAPTPSALVVATCRRVGHPRAFALGATI